MHNPTPPFPCHFSLVSIIGGGIPTETLFKSALFLRDFLPSRCAPPLPSYQRDVPPLFNTFVNARRGPQSVVDKLSSFIPSSAQPNFSSDFIPHLFFPPLLPQRGTRTSCPPPLFSKGFFCRLAPLSFQSPFKFVTHAFLFLHLFLMRATRRAARCSYVEMLLCFNFLRLELVFSFIHCPTVPRIAPGLNQVFCFFL